MSKNASVSVTGRIHLEVRRAQSGDGGRTVGLGCNCDRRQKDFVLLNRKATASQDCCEP